MKDNMNHTGAIVYICSTNTLGNLIIKYEYKGVR